MENCRLCVSTVIIDHDLVQLLHAQIPQLVYGKALTIPLQLENMGGYYSLEKTGLQAVDQVMLDYFGQFA